MTETVLVIGSNGFIGRHVADRLEEDYEVIRSARGGSGDISIEITDPESLREAPEADIVVNCAGAGDINGLESDIEGYNEVNVEGAVNVAERFDSAHLIHISSMASKGLKGPLKLPYSRSKRVGEEALKQKHESLLVVRPAEVFSEENPPELLKKASKFGVIPDNGKSTLAVDVKRLAEVVAAAVEDGKCGTIDVGRPYGVYELARESGLEGRKVILPCGVVYVAGISGEVLRHLGFRAFGTVRAESICTDRDIELEDWVRDLLYQAE